MENIYCTDFLYTVLNNKRSAERWSYDLTNLSFSGAWSKILLEFPSEHFCLPRGWSKWLWFQCPFVFCVGWWDLGRGARSNGEEGPSEPCLKEFLLAAVAKKHMLCYVWIAGGSHDISPGWTEMRGVWSREKGSAAPSGAGLGARGYWEQGLSGAGQQLAVRALMHKLSSWKIKVKQTNPAFPDLNIRSLADFLPTKMENVCQLLGDWGRTRSKAGGESTCPWKMLASSAFTSTHSFITWLSVSTLCWSFLVPENFCVLSAMIIGFHHWAEWEQNQ